MKVWGSYCWRHRLSQHYIRIWE